MPAPDEAASEGPSSLSRRRFLRRMALTTGAAGSGLFLVGCGGSDRSETAPAADSSASAAAGDASNRCVDPSTLSAEAKEGREQYDYVAQTPEPEAQCDNCQFWIADEYGETCGGCRLFAGPVHPEGFCNAYMQV